MTLNRNVAPSRTPAGTRSLSSCVDATSPPPAAGRAPLLPRSRRGRRSQCRCAAAARRAARSRPRTLPAGSARSRRSAPTGACRRKTSRASDRARSTPRGKSMATSSVSHSARPLVAARCALQAAVVRASTGGIAAARRRRGTPPGTPPRSSPEMSGWYRRASCRYARLISSAPASGDTPRTS